jgi:hypothetical protein
MSLLLEAAPWATIISTGGKLPVHRQPNRNKVLFVRRMVRTYQTLFLRGADLSNNQRRFDLFGSAAGIP